MANPRPPFIVSSHEVQEVAGRYPGSDETLSYGRAIGRVAGLRRIGLHLERVPPGQRTSYPHAEKDEEEFAYVLEGEIDVWIDGELHHLRAGDLAAFPAGTGIAHTFINDSDREAVLLVGGERNKPDNQISYPLNPERRRDMPWSHWWDEVPKRVIGAHDGRPRKR